MKNKSGWLLLFIWIIVLGVASIWGITNQLSLHDKLDLIIEQTKEQNG